MERKVFRSRISVSWLIFFGVFMGGIIYRISNIESSFFNPGSYIIIGAIVFAFFAFRSVYYVLTDKEIQINYFWGIMGKPYARINISVITSIERSYDLVGGIAASLKRLRFRFKKGYKWNPRWPCIPLVSPVREQEFLEMLKGINPDIQIRVNDKKGWWRFWDWDF